jgi:hypothetical protein
MSSFLACALLVLLQQMGATERVPVTSLMETIGDHRSDSVHLATHDEIAELSLGEGEGDMYDDVDVACYCKAVDDISKCEDNKHPSKPEKPSGPRFFHPDADLKKGKSVSLCCKLDWTSFFSWVGWDYKKQEDLTRCKRESRPVPSSSCCHLKDEHGAFGVRINKATSKSAMVTRAAGGYRLSDPKFLKTPPEIKLEDITGGQDYTGTDIPAEDVREFVEMQLTQGGRFNGKLQCGGDKGSFAELLADGGACHLRDGPSEQCCCHVASVVEAERCLPAKGAASEEEAQRKEVESALETWSEHGHKAGRIVHAAGPDTERGMQVTISNMPDPLAENNPETQDDESGMRWDWTKATNQWTKKCLEPVQVPYVKSTRHSKRVRDGQTCRQIGKVRHCSPKYKTVYSTTYSQQFKAGCTKWQWDRKCAAGSGLYVKQIPPGQCVPEPERALPFALNLTEIGPLLYMCPDDYVSGTGGTENYHPKCACRPECGER